MKMLIIVFAVLMQTGIFVAAPLSHTASSSDAHLEFAEVYLEKFYGFKPQMGRRRRTLNISPDGFTAKLKEMQHFFGLAESGQLDMQTIRVMREARCGLSDAEPFGEGTRWKSRTLSYRISTYSTKMKPSQTRKAFREAWRIWAQVAPLKFKARHRREADIAIAFNNRDHEDGSPFDGKGGVLAHAFYPGSGIGGDVHFDAEEDWMDNATGYNLFAVAVHEFGHALGLHHSSDPGAVMFPAYNFAPQDELQLSFQDVKDIQELYGSVKLDKPPPRTPDKCDPFLSFDAVTGLQQELVFFKERFMWRMHSDFNNIGTTLIKSLWSDIPASIDAAYENMGSNTMIFFKGSQYWKVKDLVVEDGYPKNISEFGFPLRIKAVDAVLYFRESHITEFFTGEECWRYDEEQRRIIDGFPKALTQEWPGVPSPIDAAVDYGGLVYFFIGNMQLEFDPKHRRVTRKMPANSWLRCGGESTTQDVFLRLG